MNLVVLRLCTLSVILHEKMGYTVGTEVQMDRDVEFLKTILAKSLFSIYPDPLTSCIDLYYRFRWGLFSKVPTHAM